jgi:hypothetical protein
VVESFENTLKDNKETLKNHEKSELNLFRGRIYEKLGDYKSGA